MDKDEEFDIDGFFQISEESSPSKSSSTGFNVLRNSTSNISSTEFQFSMEEMGSFNMEDYNSEFVNKFDNNSAWNNSSDDELPIDMRFNDGHLISITVYSILFVCSAIGKLFWII